MVILLHIVRVSYIFGYLISYCYSTGFNEIAIHCGLNKCDTKVFSRTSGGMV